VFVIERESLHACYCWGWLELEPKRPEFYNKITANITQTLQQQRGLSLAFFFSPLKKKIFW